MNFFGIPTSLPAPTTAPFAPEGAPIRPGHFTSGHALAVSVPICVLMWLALGSASPFPSSVGPPVYPFVYLGILALIGVFITPFYQRFRYDSIGWYEHRDVALPELPFEMRDSDHRVQFGTEGITFSGFLMRPKTIAYSEIMDVLIDCQGHCLTGVRISRSTKPYYGANEPKSAHASFLISDDNQYPQYGENTRTALAILRAKAPHAVYRGPKWVEEGWVPRLGFTRRDNGSGSGAGP